MPDALMDQERKRVLGILRQVKSSRARERGNQLFTWAELWEEITTAGHAFSMRFRAQHSLNPMAAASLLALAEALYRVWMEAEEERQAPTTRGRAQDEQPAGDEAEQYVSLAIDPAGSQEAREEAILRALACAATIPNGLTSQEQDWVLALIEQVESARVHGQVGAWAKLDVQARQVGSALNARSKGEQWMTTNRASTMLAFCEAVYRLWLAAEVERQAEATGDGPQDERPTLEGWDDL